MEETLLEHIRNFIQNSQQAFARHSREARMQATPLWARAGRLLEAEEPVHVTELGFMHERMGLKQAIVWDRLVVPVAETAVDTSNFDALLQQVLFEARIRFSEDRPLGALPLPTAGPLDRYHPERFRSQHQFGKTVASMAMNELEPGSGVADSDFMQHVMEVLMTDIQRVGLYSTVRERNDAGSVSLLVSKKAELALHYGLYVRAGRQLYDFPASMVEMFRQTSVDQIPVSALKFPYPAQYLYFGPQTDLELRPGWSVDGAYVCFHEAQPEHGGWKVLTIVVTAAPSSPDFVRWDVVSEPSYTQAMGDDELTKDLGAAVEAVLQEKMRTLAPLLEKPDNVPVDLSALEESGIRLGMEVSDVSARTARQSVAETERTHKVYQEALKLVINGIAYLSSYPDDINTAYPENTPASLREKLTSMPTKAQKTKSKLASMGFTPVHYCGQQARREQPATGNATGRTQKVTWRQGHWRHQAHGAGRLLRKLLWIKPVLVNAALATHDPDELGHIYLVEDDGVAT